MPAVILEASNRLQIRLPNAYSDICPYNSQSVPLSHIRLNPYRLMELRLDTQGPEHTAW